MFEDLNSLRKSTKVKSASKNRISNFQKTTSEHPRRKSKINHINSYKKQK